MTGWLEAKVTLNIRENIMMNLDKLVKCWFKTSEFCTIKVKSQLFRNRTYGLPS
jgi:hypothetical protein